jgi:hypothetical protein
MVKISGILADNGLEGKLKITDLVFHEIHDM